MAVMTAQARRPDLLARLSPGTTIPGESAGRLGLGVVALCLVVLFTLQDSAFLTVDNFVVIAVNMTSILIAVVGASALLISGGVDLSIGSMLALVAMVVAKVAASTQDAALAVVVGVLLGLLLGLLNGLLVRVLRISPLIVTVAMLAVYRGAAFVVSDVSIYRFPAGLVELGRGRALGVPYTVIIALVIFGVCAFALTRTVTGLRIYAIGGDARAAELSGVPVARIRIGLYACNGLLIGMAAVLTAGRLGSVTPTIGIGFELDVLTAAILGGVAFTGGAGRPAGMFIGVASIGILGAGLIFSGLQSFWQQIAPGGLLLLALLADQIAVYRRDRRARSAAPSTTLVAADGPPASPPREPIGSPSTDGEHSGLVFSVVGARKTYGAVRALEEASFSVHRGEVVCLLGDNGAGKSTLVKIISGAVRPDAGTMTLDGQGVSFASPGDARASGLETVYQDLALCPNLSIAHNMMLGREPRRRWLGLVPIRDDRMAAESCRRRLGELGIRLQDEHALVRSLSGGNASRWPSPDRWATTSSSSASMSRRPRSGCNRRPTSWPSCGPSRHRAPASSP